MYHASPHLTYLLQTDLLKPDVSKLNYPLYPPWDWAEKSEGFFSPNLRCITSGVVDGGSGRQICKSPFHWEYMIILNHTTKYLFIEWDDGWNTDFFTLPVIGFASTNLNFKSVFVRFVRVVRIPSPRFINFHLSSGGMIADNHFK